MSKNRLCEVIDREVSYLLNYELLTRLIFTTHYSELYVRTTTDINRYSQS